MLGLATGSPIGRSQSMLAGQWTSDGFGIHGAARGFRTSAGGRRAYVLEGGRGGSPTVLLLHGLGSLAEEIFTAVGPPLLRSGFRVVAPDRPGYGQSDPL